MRLIPHRVGRCLKARAGEELQSVTLGQGSDTFQPPYFTLAKCHVCSSKRSKGSWLLFHYFVLHVAASFPSFRLFLAKKGDAHGDAYVDAERGVLDEALQTHTMEHNKM